MDDIFGRVVTFILCSIIMFIVPVLIVQKSINNTRQMEVYNEVCEFVENAKNTGVIDKDMYKRMTEKITSFVSGVKITMSCTRFVYEQDDKELTLAKADFNDDILHSIENEKEYLMNIGDYLKVEALVGNEVICIYGGGIKNEIN